MAGPPKCTTTTITAVHSENVLSLLSLDSFFMASCLLFPIKALVYFGPCRDPYFFTSLETAGLIEEYNFISFKVR